MTTTRKSTNCIFLLLFLSILSCNSLDKDEYEILNKVTEQYVYPDTDMNLFFKTRKNNDVSFKDAVNIVQSEMSQKEYKFSISDTIYPAIISKELSENLHNSILFFEIEDRSDKPLIADFNKILFRKNMKRIHEKIDDTTYVGHFKLHRVLFDKTKERAYVQIETPQNNYPSFIGVLFRKVKGEWIQGE